MSPNVNEVHSNEEGAMKEEEEVVNFNKDVAREDEEGTVNNAGSLKGVLESYLQIDNSLVARELLRCKKLSNNSGNTLKQDVESLPILLQVVHFKFSLEM